MRLSAAPSLTTREQAFTGSALSDFLTDTVLMNGMIEKVPPTQDNPQGRRFALKRPGLGTTYTYGPGGTVHGQGTFFDRLNQTTFAVGSNVLYPFGSYAAATGASWTLNNTGPFPPRTQFGAATLNGKMFIAGGTNIVGIKVINDVWSSSDGVNWSLCTGAAPWPQLTGHGSLVAMGGLLYAFSFASVWSSSDGANWTLCTSSPPWTTLTGYMVIATGQALFVMGGVIGAAYQNTVYTSNDGTNWTTLQSTAAFTARQQAGVAFFAGKLWVYGGSNGASMTSVYSSPDGIAWTATGNLPAASNLFASCVYAGRLWAVAAGAASTAVYASVDGATWTTPTTNYGGGVVPGAQVLVGQLTAGSNATMWLIAGNGAGTPRSSIYTASLDGTLSASYAISTAAPNTEQFNFDTINNGVYTILKNTFDAWVFWAAQLTKISSPNYPAVTVPGVVVLDDTAYVMGPDGTLYGCDLSNPFGWSALNFITADFDASPGVAVVKYLEYVLALKGTCYQLFYDAGRFPGAPLLPIQQANTKIGCASAGSVVKMMNTVVFMASSNTQGRYLGMMDGYLVKPISDANINRILNSFDLDPTITTVNAWGAKVNGHDVYLITLDATGFGLAAVTLIYDFTSQEWYVWRDSAGGTFKGINYLTDTVNDLVQHPSLGIIYTLSPTLFQDDGASFTTDAILETIDGGNNYLKFEAGVQALGDYSTLGGIGGANLITILQSDDDGQTYLSRGTVDLSLPFDVLPRGGSFYKRKYRWQHAANNPLRIEFIQADLSGSYARATA